MNLQELDNFRLADAISFHDELNPKLFAGNKLKPQVKEQLLTIAQDFLEELGVNELDVKDITISGSNAAYTYTKHSDIDLHILVNMNDLPQSDVYKELFNAKKTIYNDTHDITIHDIPVELYVQDSNEPVKSLGEYSLKHDKWLRVPTKQRANFDEKASSAKYGKLLELVKTALKTKDTNKLNKILKKIKQYRQAGLDKKGEFGPENLAYKALRSQGYITKLYDLRDKLHSERLSIEGMYSVEDYHPNEKPPGPEFKPTMPKGTVKVDVSDVYDWYKLGQHISNLKGLGKHDFGKGPPSTILSFGDEDTEHQYIQDLLKTGLSTTDIDPVDPKQPKGMKRQKVDPTYNVNEDDAITLQNLPKYFKDNDPLAELVPERKNKIYALHPDKWESTYFSLTGKDPKKLKYHRPKNIEIPDGTLVGDMAIANKFYRAKNDEDKQLFAKLYSESLKLYPVDLSNYKMPELLIPKQVEVSEAKVPSVRQQIINDVKKNGGNISDYFVRFTDSDKLGFSAKQGFGKTPDVDNPNFDVDYIGQGEGRRALWFYPLSYFLKEKNDLYASNQPYAWLVKLKPNAWMQTVKRGDNKVVQAPEGKQRVGMIRMSNPPAAIFFTNGFDLVGRYYDYAGQHKRHGDVKGKPSPSLFDKIRGVAEDFSGDNEYHGMIMSMVEGEDGFKLTATSPKGTKLGFVEFSYDTDGTIKAEELEVYEKFRGQGIAKTMYDYVKEQGFTIARSSEQTPNGAARWDKNKPNKKIWEQGVAESFSNEMSTEDMIAYLRQHHDKNLHPDYIQHLQTFSKFVLKDIPVNSIKTELAGLDKEKVEQYKKMDFTKAPPIVMGNGYILDGYHRATVAKALGIPTIKAYVGIKGKQGVTEGTTTKKFNIKKGKNSFSIELVIDDKPVGIYQYNNLTNRHIAEVYPEFKGKGYGKLLVLKALQTAGKLGMDFIEDESRTNEYDNVIDSLESSGLLVRDGEYLYLTQDGLNYLKSNLQEGASGSRQYLYHATYRPLLKSIQKNGLGGSGAQAKYEDSAPGVTYLAVDRDVAISYAETSDMVPDEWLDEIVVLKIPASKLDKSKLHIDRNVQDNEGDTLEYHGIIPFSLVQLSESASGYIPSDAEKNDPRFKTALTVDIKPDSIKKNAKKLGLGNIHRSGVPPTARSNGKID